MTYPAGPNLDLLIVERVFGGVTGHTGIDEDGAEYERVPRYSTEIDDAWEVVEKMAERGWPLWGMGALVTLGGPSSFTAFAQFAQGWLPQWKRAEAETAPHAICLAALEAVASHTLKGINE